MIKTSNQNQIEFCAWPSVGHVFGVDPPAASALLSASLRHVYGMTCKATEQEVANLDSLEALKLARLCIHSASILVDFIGLSVPYCCARSGAKREDLQRSYGVRTLVCDASTNNNGSSLTVG